LMLFFHLHIVFKNMEMETKEPQLSYEAVGSCATYHNNGVRKC